MDANYISLVLSGEKKASVKLTLSVASSMNAKGLSRNSDWRVWWIARRFPGAFPIKLHPKLKIGLAHSLEHPAWDGVRIADQLRLKNIIINDGRGGIYPSSEIQRQDLQEWNGLESFKTAQPSKGRENNDS